MIFIPESHLLTYDKAFNSKIGQEIITKDISLKSPKHSLLAVFFLLEQEKGNKSFWEPYIQSLPSEMDSLPISFEEKTLSLLKGSSFLPTILKKRKFLFEDYEQLKSNLDGFSRFSLEDFTHFRAMASSRVFGFDIRGKRSGAMIPFAGKLNLIRYVKSQKTKKISLGLR